MKAINVDGQMTAKELLSLVDGYYKLEKPIGYTMGGSGTMDYVSTEQELDYITTDANPYVSAEFGAPVENMTMPTIGESYHLKLEFQSGVVVEREVEFSEGTGMLAGSPTLYFTADMFDGLDQGYNYLSCRKEGNQQGVMGRLAFNTSKDETIAKYGNSISITVTGKTTSATGEISGMININTDVKILDGITKVITSLADDTSYYIENVWQDGTAVEVNAMDEGSEGSGGSGGDFSTAMVTLKNNGSGDYSIIVPCLPNTSSMPSCTAVNAPINPGDPLTIEVPLYNGSAGILRPNITSVDTSVEPILEGACKLKSAGIVEWFEITGDCTITLFGNAGVA